MNKINSIWINRSWYCEVCGSKVSAAKSKDNRYKARCMNCGTVIIKDAAGVTPDKVYLPKKKTVQ